MNNILKISNILTICLLMSINTVFGQQEPQIGKLENVVVKENQFDFAIKGQNYTLQYSSQFSKDNAIIESSLILTSEKTTSTIKFKVDIQENEWKYNQSTKIIEKANELKEQNFSLGLLEDVVSDINNYLDYLIYENSKLNSLTLFSSLYYNKAILNTVIRAEVNKKDCNCTTHPEFLSDISYFKCQEDHYMLVSAVSKALEEFKVKNPKEVDVNFENLFSFINNYKGGAYVPFKTYYEVYTGELFPPIPPFTPAGRCLFGQGSDHGCCGNYQGCCWYRYVLCFVHDEICINCKPKWFCLPGCKPGYTLPPQINPNLDLIFNGYNYDPFIATDLLIDKLLQVERYIRK